MKPVVTIAPLPYPNSQPDTIVTRQLDNFDRDLRKTLVDYLFTVAFRLNNTLPKDGSEPMSGSLNMGGFNITNVGSITTSGNVTVGGTVTASMTRLTSTADVSLSSTDHAFQIGDTAGQNIAADANEIQSRNNGATATMFLQNEGGDLQVGNNTSSINMIGGKLKFPATQQASADPNTFDDYEEGTWTPTVTFQTPGDVAVTYATRIGTYVKWGKYVTIFFRIITSTFTHTTAANEMRITGVPFTSVTLTDMQWLGAMEIDGITLPAGYTQVTANIQSNSSFFRPVRTGSGVGRAALTAGDHASGTNSAIQGSITYEAVS